MAKGGWKWSEESRKKFSEQCKKENKKAPDRTGSHHSGETIEKLRELSTGNTYRRGKKASPEAREKMSLAKKGRPSWNKGISMSAETKKRISETKLSQRTSGPTYNSRYQTSEWKQKRLEIYKRDEWICQNCGKQTSISFGKDRICCHHIDYNHKNLDSNNLITLCWSCHARTNGNRPFWTSRFSTEGN